MKPDVSHRSQDLRVQCRQRKLSPAGCREELGERLKERMLETQDLYASASLLQCRVDTGPPD